MALNAPIFAVAQNHTASRWPIRIGGSVGSLLALLVLCSGCAAQGAAPPPEAPASGPRGGPLPAPGTPPPEGGPYVHSDPPVRIVREAEEAIEVRGR